MANNSQHCWILHVASVCTPRSMLLDVVVCCCAKFETGQNATTPNIVAPTVLGVLETCWQWCANGCNNFQQCWDLQCIVRRIQPISLCKPCVISVRGPNNVGRALQTDPTLLRYASVITEQKKCWEMWAEKFDRFQILRNNIQQHATGFAN